MPYMNKSMLISDKQILYILFLCPLGGLHKQFSSFDCVLDYMSNYKHKENLVFQNYVIIFLHVLRGLQFLQSRGIVNRDVKG